MTTAWSKGSRNAESLCRSRSQCQCAPGGVTFHHGCTFHYAGPNRSDRPRRAFAIIYIPDYTRFTGGKDAAGAAEEMEIGGPWDHVIHPIVAGR